MSIDGDIRKPRRHRFVHDGGEVLVLLSENLITVSPGELPTIGRHLNHGRKSTDFRPHRGWGRYDSRAPGESEDLS